MPPRKLLTLENRLEAVEDDDTALAPTPLGVETQGTY
jgi:hypothetical protein